MLRLICPIFLFYACLPAQGQQQFVSSQKTKDGFALAASGKPAAIFASNTDYPGVLRAVRDLQSDIGKVTGTLPSVDLNAQPAGTAVVIAGTLGKSEMIDQLVRDKKIDVKDVAGKWESFIIQVIENPTPNIKRALVIAGSDKRGTIFGIYEMSKQIGVSPWYWWADAPVSQSPDLYVKPGRNVQGEPAVKYRGLFINDEEPALGRWAVENYGGFKHEFYEKVFELILRLKGNYLWPAMWWASFNSDDTLNPSLADEYGIVIGTTHHEPMMRAHAEWKPFGGGEWNYETNPDKLKQFWTEGIKRMGDRESIVSLGMRGDGDKAMTAETNVALLQRIVADQRKILEEVTGKSVASTPQLWALYKEVQDYYDNGMRVPDDITLLLCDDNWGNIRKLPRLSDPKRSGGYGIYYHFDYVGGPRNYKWLNTSPISRVWEQMHLALEYGADRIWIVNVGDIKPMEFPISFFMDYAWDPKPWDASNLDAYTDAWAARLFGPKHQEIARVISTYTKFNSRRKPELLSPDTYSLVNYHEAETVVNEYNKLAADAERIYEMLPEEYKDAYYQLVLFPVKACANLNELFVTVGRNRMYARQGRSASNQLADKAKSLFAMDSTLAKYYNKTISKGKWNHLMDQTHISYTYWQQPPKDVLPAVKKIDIPEAPDMGIAIEGDERWWPEEKGEAVLPEFDSFNQQIYYIDIFNRGRIPFNFTTGAEKPWIKFGTAKGTVEKETRVAVSIDWKIVPTGVNKTAITISGPGQNKIVVQAIIKKPASPVRDQVTGFVESNGYTSMEAVHYTTAVNTKEIQWKVLPDIGRTLSGISPSPVTAEIQTPGAGGPHLEYQIELTGTGETTVQVYFSPTLNFPGGQGLKYGISIDDETPQIINVHDDKSNRTWEKWVADNILIKTSKHNIAQPGRHVLKFWMVDPGLVLQKIVVSIGTVKPSYLGPPESFYRIPKSNK